MPAFFALLGYETPAATKIEPTKPAAHNLRIMRTFLFGNRSFR